MDKPMYIRVPEDAVAELSVLAKASRRSLNGQICYILLEYLTSIRSAVSTVSEALPPTGSPQRSVEPQFKGKK